MASAVDLTFAEVSPRVQMANVKSKTALESYRCPCPFGSDIRKRVRRDVIRMSEPGHWNMIALTDAVRKGSLGANLRAKRGESSDLSRHGIVSGITIQPFFRQPPAALDCEKHCTALARFFRFRIPQPPAPRDRRDRA